MKYATHTIFNMKDLTNYINEKLILKKNINNSFDNLDFNRFKQIIDENFPIFSKEDVNELNSFFRFGSENHKWELDYPIAYQNNSIRFWNGTFPILSVEYNMGDIVVFSFVDEFDNLKEDTGHTVTSLLKEAGLKLKDIMEIRDNIREIFGTKEYHKHMIYYKK